MVRVQELVEAKRVRNSSRIQHLDGNLMETSELLCFNWCTGVREHTIQCCNDTSDVSIRATSSGPIHKIV